MINKSGGQCVVDLVNPSEVEALLLIAPVLADASCRHFLGYRADSGIYLFLAHR